MSSSTRAPARDPRGDRDGASSRAAGLSDNSARGARMSDLANLTRSGPKTVAQRRHLAGMFAGVAQLGRDKVPKKTGGGKPKVSETDLIRYFWLFLLQRFLDQLNEAYPQNNQQPDSGHVATKDQLMHPPTSGVKGSDHHTDTSGGGKKGRHVSSKQLKSDVEKKIGELLELLNLASVPDHCRSNSGWDTWRKDNDPGGGGGGLTA